MGRSHEQVLDKPYPSQFNAMRTLGSAELPKFWPCCCVTEARLCLPPVAKHSMSLGTSSPMAPLKAVHPHLPFPSLLFSSHPIQWREMLITPWVALTPA